MRAGPACQGGLGVTMIGRSILGGAVGTVLLTSMMYFVAVAMTGRTMDIAGMLGSMVGGSWVLGMMIHIVNGTLVFPVIYAVIVSPRVSGAPWFRGLLWGVILWLVAQMLVMPFLGVGFFSAHGGGMRSVVTSLFGHLVYGAALGAVAGAPEKD